MDIDQYKKLYKKILAIVNEIDPGYYNGPDDEYDSQVNGIIKLIQAGEIQNTRQFIKLFFGENENVTDEQNNKIKKIIERIQILL